MRFFAVMLVRHWLLLSRCQSLGKRVTFSGQRDKATPCGYLIKARSGWGLFPLLRSHRDEEAESRGEMDEQDEEVELRRGWGVGRLFLLFRPCRREEASALDVVCFEHKHKSVEADHCCRSTTGWNSNTQWSKFETFFKVWTHTSLDETFKALNYLMNKLHLLHDKLNFN